MRQFFLVAVLFTAAFLVVAALVFRSSRALDTLRFLRNAAWAYIALIVLIAIWRIWQDGL